VDHFNPRHVNMHTADFPAMEFGSDQIAHRPFRTTFDQILLCSVASQRNVSLG